EAGNVKQLADGSADQTVNDVYLRTEFPPPGKAKAPRPGDTPTDRYLNGLAALGRALEGVDRTFTELTKIAGDDGQPIVDARGVEP
ncbi:hypothetical protein ACC699_38995, partial [Rhizobium ruizarguesonis]